MPPFKFRLQPVLSWRERIEQQKQMAMAQAQRVLADARHRLGELEFNHLSTAELLRLGHSKLDVEELRHHYAHLEYLQREIKDQQVRIAACEAEVEHARRILIAAAKDRKVIERLRVRKREAYDNDAAMLEQRESDDANARRYSRRPPSLGSML